MWARIVEVMLGVWLALSPFIFRIPTEERFLWWNDLFAAAVIVALALTSFKPELERAHLGLLPVAAWLVVSAYWLGSVPPEPAFQNHVVVGWLLAMFAIIPSRSDTPPRAWERFYLEREDPHPGVPEEPAHPAARTD